MPTKAELEATITELKRTNEMLLIKILELYERLHKSTGLLTPEDIEPLYTLIEKYKIRAFVAQKTTDIAINKIVDVKLINNDHKKKYRKRENTKSENTNAVWDTIRKQFNDILVERDLPKNNHLLIKGDKKLIRREANDRAESEKFHIKGYSDDKLGKMLKFPEVVD